MDGYTRPMKHLTGYGIFALSLIISCAVQTPSGAQDLESNVDGARLTKNCQLAAEYSARHKGRAVLVLLGGQVICERYDNGHTADKPVHLHSATKSFWGPVAAAMLQDGLMMSLNEQVADTVTDWQSDGRKRRITVRELLNLTSGLRQAHPLKDPLRDPRTSDKYQHAIGLEAAFEPGARFIYGPNHYYVLGAWMKRKLANRNQSPVDYLKQRILDPIGVKVARWDHDPSGNPDMPNGAYLTARDWARFGQLLLQGGEWDRKRIIRKDLLELCFEPSKANPGYGLTFWLNRPNGRGPQILGNPVAPKGAAAGFIFPEGYPDLFMAAGTGKNLLYVIPSLKMVVVRQAEGEQIKGYDDAVFLGLLLKDDQRRTATGQEDTTDPTSNMDSAQERARKLIARFDKDNNQKLSRIEIPQQMKRLVSAFNNLDGDRDGQLSVDELAPVLSRFTNRETVQAKDEPEARAPSTKTISDASRTTSAVDRVVRISPPGASYIDPEILQLPGKMTFQYQDQIWVADLNPDTGAFVSTTGRDYLMDGGAARLGSTFNGPEFGLNARGWAVYYAKEYNGTMQIWRSAWRGTCRSVQTSHRRIASSNPASQQTCRGRLYSFIGYPRKLAQRPGRMARRGRPLQGRFSRCCRNRRYLHALG